MNYSTLTAELQKLAKGEIHTIVFERKLKTLKNVSDDIRKIETVQVSFGVDYDHKKAVIEARANGQLPATNQGLAPNLEWVVFPYIIRNKQTDEYQLRCNGLKTKKHEIVYIKNGTTVSASDIIADCRANEVHVTLPDPRPTFNLGIDKLISIC